MTEPKMTVDLPFSPEDVRAGRVKFDPFSNAGRIDRAWGIVMENPELKFARKKLSIHEIRHIIRAVAEAFK